MEYGLIGCPLGHSLSPRLHTLLADYDYRLYEIQERELEPLLRGKRFCGLNVTIPYKQAVLPYCDVLSERVQRIGSANTLYVRDGLLYAENTDYFGFARLLASAPFSVCGKKAALLGTGGTSRTVQAVLKDAGVGEVVTVSRGGPTDYEALYREHGDAGIIVNTTPVGMWPDTESSPVTLDRLPNVRGVLDVIYRPYRTKLMREAEALSIPAVGGLAMLVWQAWESAMLFTGQAIPRERAERALLALQKELEEMP